MPFTPFHFGPGLLCKGFLEKRFSLSAFILCQVMIDVEVLVYLWTGSERIHQLFHTYLGSLIPALISFGLVWVFQKFMLSQRFKVSIPVLLTSVLIGSWSHVAMDSLMHADMFPLWPFTQINSLLGVVGISSIHIGCILSATVGILILVFRIFVQSYERNSK